MGGSLGFTIREEDGTEHRMCRWTNATPNLINHSKFISKDKEHLQNYLKTWHEMVEDYKEGTKKLNMTDAYAPYPFLAPMDYGLIVADYQTNTILHQQGYTDFGKLLPVSLELSASGVRVDEEATKEVEDAKLLFSTGKITEAECWDKKTNKFKIVKIKSLDEVFENIDRKPKRLFAKPKYDIRFTNLLIDMNPWTIKRFEEDLKGLNNLKAEVLKLGFIITPEEEEVWKEFAEKFEE